MFRTEKDPRDVRVPDRVDREPPPWPRYLIKANWIYRSQRALSAEAVMKVSRMERDKDQEIEPEP